MSKRNEPSSAGRTALLIILGLAGLALMIDGVIRVGS